MTDKMTVDEALEKSCVCSDGLCPACERFTTMFATLRDELARVRGERDNAVGHAADWQIRANAIAAERDALRADAVALAVESLSAIEQYEVMVDAEWGAGRKLDELTRDGDRDPVALKLQAFIAARAESGSHYLGDGGRVYGSMDEARADGAQNIIGPLPARAESGRE